MRGAPITLVETCPGPVAQKRIHGLAFGHGIAWELVAEIVESEFETRGKFERVGDGFGQVGEELLHFLRGDFKKRSALRVSRRPAVERVR